MAAEDENAETNKAAEDENEATKAAQDEDEATKAAEDENVSAGVRKKASFDEEVATVAPETESLALVSKQAGQGEVDNKDFSGRFSDFSFLPRGFHQKMIELSMHVPEDKLDVGRVPSSQHSSYAWRVFHDDDCKNEVYTSVGQEVWRRMQRLDHNFVQVWRKMLDWRGKGHVTRTEFAEFCRKMSITQDIREFWERLDPFDCGTMKLEAFDFPAAELLGHVASRLAALRATPEGEAEIFRRRLGLDQGLLEQEEFVKNMVEMGIVDWTDAEAVFDLIVGRSARRRRITMNDLRWLEHMRPWLPDLRLREDLKLKLGLETQGEAVRRVERKPCRRGTREAGRMPGEDEECDERSVFERLHDYALKIQKQRREKPVPLSQAERAHRAYLEVCKSGYTQLEVVQRLANEKFALERRKKILEEEMYGWMVPKPVTRQPGDGETAMKRLLTTKQPKQPDAGATQQDRPAFKARPAPKHCAASEKARSANIVVRMMQDVEARKKNTDERAIFREEREEALHAACKRISQVLYLNKGLKFRSAHGKELHGDAALRELRRQQLVHDYQEHNEATVMLAAAEARPTMGNPPTDPKEAEECAQAASCRLHCLHSDRQEKLARQRDEKKAAEEAELEYNSVHRGKASNGEVWDRLYDESKRRWRQAQHTEQIGGSPEESDREEEEKRRIAKKLQRRKDAKLGKRLSFDLAGLFTSDDESPGVARSSLKSTAQSDASPEAAEAAQERVPLQIRVARASASSKSVSFGELPGVPEDDTASPASSRPTPVQQSPPRRAEKRQELGSARRDGLACSAEKDGSVYAPIATRQDAKSPVIAMAMARVAAKRSLQANADVKRRSILDAPATSEVAATSPQCLHSLDIENYAMKEIVQLLEDTWEDRLTTGDDNNQRKQKTVSALLTGKRTPRTKACARSLSVSI